MEYMQLSMDDYIQSKNEIKQELGGIVKSFVRIGWQLTRILRTMAYRMGLKITRIKDLGSGKEWSR